MGDMMNNLNWLMKWFENNCDGEWEHYNQIQIYTLDNPGWGIEISLTDTYLEERQFETVQEYMNDNNWIHCSKNDGLFKGGGDCNKLDIILEIFREWAKK